VKQNPQQQINQAAMLASVVGQVGCLIVFIIAIALGVGMLIDKFLGTNAIFTVLLMVGSVPVALYVTVRLSLTAVARAQQKLSEANETEEESKA
jgi:magnesium-transporting ATPase (P-type)